MSVYTWQLAACKHFFKQGSCKHVHVYPQLVFSWNNLIVSGFQDCLKVWYNRYLLFFCYSDLQRINLRSLRESGHALKTHCIFHTHTLIRLIWILHRPQGNMKFCILYTLSVPLGPVSWQHPGTLASLLQRFVAAPWRVAFLPQAVPIPATNDSHSATVTL